MASDVRYFQDSHGHVYTDRSETAAKRSIALGYTEVRAVSLDDLVVSHEALPKVQERPGSLPAQYIVEGLERYPFDSTLDHERLALAHLAIRKFQRAQLETEDDEEQVKALADLLESDEAEDALEWGMRAVARFLVDQGIRVSGEGDE